jgi:hypothetical protein
MRIRIRRKLDEAKALSELIDISRNIISMENDIDAKKYPLIHSYLTRNTSVLLRVLQNRENEVNNVKITSVRINGDFLSELVGCPDEISDLLIRQSDTIGKLYKALHPYRHRYELLWARLQLFAMILKIFIRASIYRIKRTSLQRDAVHKAKVMKDRALAEPFSFA